MLYSLGLPLLSTVIRSGCNRWEVVLPLLVKALQLIMALVSMVRVTNLKVSYTQCIYQRSSVSVGVRGETDLEAKLL